MADKKVYRFTFTERGEYKSKSGKRIKVIVPPHVEVGGYQEWSGKGVEAEEITEAIKQAGE